MPGRRIRKTRATINMGTRVRDKRERLAHRTGTVMLVLRREDEERVAVVQWDDGGNQLCYTSDLRKLKR